MQKRLNSVTGREMNNNGGGTGNEIWNGGSGGRRHLKHRSNALLHNTRRKITASPSLRRRLWRHSETSETLWGQFEDKAVMTGFKERKRRSSLRSISGRNAISIPHPSLLPDSRTTSVVAAADRIMQRGNGRGRTRTDQPTTDERTSVITTL